jgi:hypothetical protein
MSITLRLIISGVLFVLSIASGIWLSNMGRPLNTVIFTVHKLIALAFAVFTGILVFNLLKTVQTEFIIVILVIFSGLFILSLFVSGGFLSIEKPVNKIILNIHRIMPVLSAVIVAVTFYLLLIRK